MHGLLARLRGVTKLPFLSAKRASFSMRLSALILAATVGTGAQAVTNDPRIIVGPYYPWVQFDANRSLELAPILIPRTTFSERAEWRFVDDARHISTFFPEESALQYTVFRTDDPETIVLLGGMYRSRRCNREYPSSIPCPLVEVFLSQDGGQHFLKRGVILPPLKYSVGQWDLGPRLPIPVVLVRQGVLYLIVSNADAKPRVLGDDYPGNIGVPVKWGDRMGLRYTWPEDYLPLWDWRMWSERPRPWKAQPTYVYAVELPQAEAAPADEVPLSEHPTRVEQVCSWRRMKARSSGLPPLNAVSVVGSRLDAFGELPAFEMPMKAPYSTLALIQASYSEDNRARLLQDMQADYPDWVASQQPVARLFPEMLAPHGNTAKVKDSDIQCAP
ncbi:hypothetical protein [Burkholderia lata]|uniref:Lipoprotein n=1 Tax=Burkholderia lata (strain ATCC 17760 / DSM 23089 / LMG 22485 / NCIMB 9086 / R18194 / 383) TaxID=482957 RepID=Q39L65_BURL3|nr:hypothetical protein [Burkholderia lata]ABB06801.1 hypothetical protein Bcep18194_A3199 [Burkholderia lata]